MVIGCMLGWVYFVLTFATPPTARCGALKGFVYTAASQSAASSRRLSLPPLPACEGPRRGCEGYRSLSRRVNNGDGGDGDGGDGPSLLIAEVRLHLHVLTWRVRSTHRGRARGRTLPR